MLERELGLILKKASRRYPVVTLTGPRQSGKTTLCRSVFSNLPYVTLEDPDVRLNAVNDPRGFLSLYPRGAVLDEIQRVPELTSYLQSFVDEPGNRRVFVLTGSQNLSLSQTVSQSLAGRTVLFRLLPFSLYELRRRIGSHSLDRILLTGFFPRIHDKKLNPTQALSAYYETYIERDLRALSNIHNLSLFQKFTKLCAGRIGQILNLSALGNEVGVTAETARQWIGLMQATYVIFLVQPFYRNFNKRIVKAPKLYFYDVGLAAFLLGINSTRQIGRDPLRGALFENLVVMDLLKTLYHRGLTSPLYYFRDNNGNEIDLLVEKDGLLHGIEIKTSQTLHPGFLKGLTYLKKLTREGSSRTCLVYGGKSIATWMGVPVFSFRECRDILA